MKDIQKKAGITFPVDDVEPAPLPLKEISRAEALGGLIDNRELIEISQPDRKLVTGVRYQPLMAAIHLAHSEHRPLILTPDAVWLTIAQGFAHHVAANAEALRHLLVPHRGRAKLNFSTKHTDWEKIIESFSKAMLERSDPALAQLVCDFSTSTSVETTASRIVLMDALQPYFEFNVYAVCGIPEITLEGSVDDWTKLKAKVESIAKYHAAWWTDRLLPLCDEFINASNGNPNREHWQDIYKLRGAYGADRINGWSILLIPYLKNGLTERCTLRNGMLSENPEDHPRDMEHNVPGIMPDMLPDSPGSAQVKFLQGEPSTPRVLEFIGGLIGVEQERTTKAVKPVAGWAIARADPFSDELNRFALNAKVVPPLDPLRAAELMDESLFLQYESHMPGGLGFFYGWCNGATLSGASMRFLSLEEAVTAGNEHIESIEKEERYASEENRLYWPVGILADGSHVRYQIRRYGEDLEYYYRDEYYIQRGEKREIIALAFEDIIRQLNENPKQPYFSASGFAPLSPVTVDNIEDMYEAMETRESESPEQRLYKNHFPMQSAWEAALKMNTRESRLPEFEPAMDGSLSQEEITALLNTPIAKAGNGLEEISEHMIFAEEIGVGTRIYSLTGDVLPPECSELFVHLTTGTSQAPNAKSVTLLAAMNRPHEELCDLLAHLLNEHHQGRELVPGKTYTIPRQGLWADLNFSFAGVVEQLPGFTGELPRSLEPSHLPPVKVFYILLLTSKQAELFNKGGVQTLDAPSSPANIYQWLR